MAITINALSLSSAPFTFLNGSSSLEENELCHCGGNSSGLSLLPVEGSASNQVGMKESQREGIEIQIAIFNDSEII